MFEETESHCYCLDDQVNEITLNLIMINKQFFHFHYNLGIQTSKEKQTNLVCFRIWFKWDASGSCNKIWITLLSNGLFNSFWALRLFIQFFVILLSLLIFLFAHHFLTSCFQLLCALCFSFPYMYDVQLGYLILLILLISME